MYIFLPTKLHDHEWVKKQFKEWLQFKNNRSWTQLHRTGYYALEEPEKLANLLAILQNESLPLSERFDRGLTPPEKVSGIAEAILTGLLHTFNPEKNGVVNSRTREPLETLRRKPINIHQGESLGEKYVKINNELHQLSKELKTDLVYIDGFMWYVSQNYSFI